MKTLLLNVPSFSGKIISPIWIKVVRDFQSKSKAEKDISSFERQEKESGFNFLHNPNNGRMQSGHIIIDGIGLFKQIIHER